MSFFLFRRQVQGWETQCQHIQWKPVCLQTGSILRTLSFHSGQEIKVLTSFGHSVKNPEGGDGAAFWLESENPYGFMACELEFSDGSSGTGELNSLSIQAAPVGA